MLCTACLFPTAACLPVQVHDTITRYREILRVNHSTEAYVIVLTKNLDPATVQAQLTLDCIDTDGAPQVALALTLDVIKTALPYVTSMMWPLQKRLQLPQPNCGPTPPAEHGCANETVALRNIGRETESFLWFITRRYDSVAEYTLFTQAAPLAAAVSAFSAVFTHPLITLPYPARRSLPGFGVICSRSFWRRRPCSRQPCAPFKHRDARYTDRV
jgi:hypothetical protein